MIAPLLAVALVAACPCHVKTDILWRHHARMTEHHPSLAERLRRATDGLLYQSETDAPVEPFLMTGFAEPEVTPAALLVYTKHDAATPVATSSVDEFFESLVAIEDWYGAEERATARRYRRVSRLLASALTDIKVFKVGDKNLDVYVVGRTADGGFAGIATKAVET